MKKVFLLVAMSLFVAVGLFAQNNNRSKKIHRNAQKGDVETRVNRLAEKLDLNAKQKKELYAHFEMLKKERETERAEAKKIRAERRTTLKAHRALNEAKLKDILGQEKYQALKEMRKDRKKKFKENKRFHHRKNRRSMQP